MSISYIKDTESKEEFIERKFKKTGSEDTKAFCEYSIKKFETFCEHILKVDSEQVIKDLTDDWTKNKDVSNCVAVIAQFMKALQEDHAEIPMATLNKPNWTWRKIGEVGQRNNQSLVRMYLRARTGIKVHSEDLSEKITIVQDTNDSLPKPLSLDQFNAFYDRCTVPRRKVKYLFMRDTGCRTIETVQITKSMIDFDFDERTGIAMVTVPRRIVKGKTQSKINFLTPEVAKKVKELCESESADSSIFVEPKHRKKSLKKIRQTEFDSFNRERDNLIKYGKENDIDYLIALDERKPSNHHEYVLHSVRSYCSTQYAKAHDEALGHGYIGHKKYLAQYMRYSEAEKLAMFEKAIPFLTGITKEYGESELAQKVKTQENQLNLQHRQIEELKKNGQKAVKAGAEQSSKWKFVVDELLSLKIVEQTDIAEILSRAPKVPIQSE